MNNSGLLFIPDISGFTKFVNETEIDHSRIIIEELLENIINSNQIGLNISEIEGDAVLFYRYGETPSLEEIYKQVENMFCNFQKQIKTYETRRVCECSACAAAINLSLKVITHYGEFSTYNVKDYSKLIGKDVIVAHQLLKNDIDLHEYWLVTSNLFDSKQIGGHLPEWINWQKSIKQTEKGEVAFYYSMLSELKEKVQPDPTPRLDLGDNKTKMVSLSKTIDASLVNVFTIMGDFSLRPKWMEGIKAVDQVSHPLYHVGIKHRCILNSGRTKVVNTSSYSHSNDTISLSETDENKTEARYITVKPLTDRKTSIVFDYYVRKNPFKELIFSMFMKKEFTRQLAKSLDNLDGLCTELQRVKDN
ncbi:MAG: DUF2652 domain-containing protein [Parafilimonas sp.]